MTGWILETNARHVPDDELHAYLDQALSRSQCVEIECHLATCRHCQVERDRVAAVRDRTTALLALAAPRQLRIPPYERVAALASQRATERRVRRVRGAVGLLAAALVAAVGASSWFSRSTPITATTPIEVAASTSATAPRLADAPPSTPLTDRVLVAAGPVAPVSAEPTSEHGSGHGAPRPRLPEGRFRAALDQVVQVASIAPETEQFVLSGLWQSVDLSEAERETAGNLPKIDGLPIIDIQLQRNNPDQRPIVVVAQQHPSGRILRTIEGPVDRVEDLLERQLTGRNAAVRASVPTMTPPDYLLDGASNARRGLRILTVMGDFATDTLNVLARGIEVRD